MTDRDREELPERLVAMVRETYHRPTETPRDDLWARIEAARRPGGAGLDLPSAHGLPGRARAPSRWLRYATGIAALIAIGIGIGRFTVRSAPGNPVTAPRDVARGTNSQAYAIAASDHLGRVETLLTTMRAEPGNPDLVNQARDLLTSTRLLLDARRVTDSRTRALLEDLETILVQVVQLDPHASAEELDLITDGMEQRQVMPRLRSAIPTGPSRL